MTRIDPKIGCIPAQPTTTAAQTAPAGEAKGPKQQRAASVATPTAPAERVKRVSGDADPFVTFLVSTKAKSERSVGMPARDALEALAEKHKDSFQRLEPNE